MADCELQIRPDGVGLVTLNRPDSLNAMGGDLMRLFGDHLEECEHNRDVRCVAVTGAGRGFCAGGDVKGMVAQQSGDGQQPSFTRMLEEGVRGLRRGQNKVTLKLFTLPKPVVALVNGAAAGAGLSVSLACDIRFCSDKARFITAFAKVGFSGDYGGSWLLQRLIGRGRALELYYTSEHIDASRALELGIANRVVPHDELLDQGLELCASIAAGPTAAFARMKENFNRGSTMSFADALDQEAMNMRISGMSADFREGSRAFVEKRSPVFTGE